MLTEKEICPGVLLFFVMKILQELYSRKGYGHSENGRIVDTEVSVFQQGTSRVRSTC